MASILVIDDEVSTRIALTSMLEALGHQVLAAPQQGTVRLPSPSVGLSRSSGAPAYNSTSSPPLVALSDNAIAPAGGDQPHNNLQPYLTLNFCIALQGVYPPRT